MGKGRWKELEVQARELEAREAAAAVAAATAE